MLEWLQLSISPRSHQECFLVQLSRHLLSYHTGYCGDVASPLRLVTRPCSSIQHARHLQVSCALNSPEPQSQQLVLARCATCLRPVLYHAIGKLTGSGICAVPDQRRPGGVLNGRPQPFHQGCQGPGWQRFPGEEAWHSSIPATAGRHPVHVRECIPQRPSAGAAWLMTTWFCVQTFSARCHAWFYACFLSMDHDGTTTLSWRRDPVTFQCPMWVVMSTWEATLTRANSSLRWVPMPTPRLSPWALEYVIGIKAAPAVTLTPFLSSLI